jgi:putative transposase
MPVFTRPAEYIRCIELIEYCHFDNTPVSFSIFNRRPKEIRQDIIRTLYRENHLKIEILAFCLMPNHYHFLIRQRTDHGISQFTGNLQNAYGKYFNLKYERTGPVFQPSFQAVRIETDEQLVHVSRYIHLNPSTSFIVSTENLPKYEWSSLPGYYDEYRLYPFINSQLVINLAGNKAKYKEIVSDQAGYQQELGKIKHLVME